MVTTSKKFELPFVKKEQLNHEVRTFYFDRSGVEYDFLAGQYNRVTLSIENPDERGTSRFFTVSSSPTDKDFLTITTKVIQSSFKLKLDSLKPGDMGTFFGPLGILYQDEVDLTPKIFLAGGMGITPAHSILRFIDNKKVNVDFTLLTSFSLKEEAIFFEELKGIESRNSNVKVVYTLTKDEGEYPGMQKGRVDESMIKNVEGYENSRYFIGGPPAMEAAVKAQVSGMGISEDQIITESFTGY